MTSFALRCHPLATAFTEQFIALAAVEADEVAHVLDHAEQWTMHLAEHPGRAHRVEQALEGISEASLLVAERGIVAELRRLELDPRRSVTAFLATEPPAHAKLGDERRFQLIRRAHQNRTILGGATYSVQILAPHS